MILVVSGHQRAPLSPLSYDYLAMLYDTHWPGVGGVLFHGRNDFFADRLGWVVTAALMVMMMIVITLANTKYSVFHQRLWTHTLTGTGAGQSSVRQFLSLSLSLSLSLALRFSLCFLPFAFSTLLARCETD
jgi:hypothetical protein